MVQVGPLVDAAPDLLGERGGGGRDLGGRGARARQPRQAHPGPPGQPPGHRQAHGDVLSTGQRPVAGPPGELPCARQRARRARGKPHGARHQQLAEPGDEPGRPPGARPDATDRALRRAGVGIPRRHRPGRPPQRTEPGGLQAAGDDGHRADHLIQSAEGTAGVPVRRAVQREAADRYVGPPPHDPRGRLRVRGRYPDRSLCRGHRPRPRVRRRDRRQPRSPSPWAEHVTYPSGTDPAPKLGRTAVKGG